MLEQLKEMLAARAFPMMRIYVSLSGKRTAEDRFGYRPSTPEPNRLKTAIIITLSTVHRHFCDSDYCYSKASCRFGFPLRLENKSKIEFEEMNGGGIRASYAEEMILEEICTTESSWYTGE
jgi:hypothetical protein